MNESKIAHLRDAGIDVDDALSRFIGNESLLERFLGKFLNDANYTKLCEAMESGDTEAALIASHTLKGVSGNLSMVTLNELLAKQVKAFRDGNTDLAKSLMHTKKRLLR